MEFRILGPLEAVADGRAVPLGGPKPRAVLTALLLDAGRVVTVDRLVGAVWGEDPPPSARNALQTYLSRLRRALGTATLRHHHGGYELVAGPDRIDARRFEAAVADARAALAAGDPATALDTVTGALALWRGPALLDVAGELFAQAEIARLTELRAVAADLRVECLLAAGRTADAVAGAAELVAADPVREGSRGQLMLALYRAGRQTEALATYRELRELLAERFGLDPGEDLEALAQSILRQDPALTPPPADEARGEPGAGRERWVPDTRLPAALDRFVGRERELADVRELLAEHRLVTLTGPGGAGKTRLAAEVCRSAGTAVRVAELAGIDDDVLLEPALAHAFGLAVDTGPGGIAAVVGDADVVLLLDNGEQLAGALAVLVPKLLAELPGLRVLVTSRLPLSVAGERRYPVPPLDPGTDAVELFLDRAAAVLPEWACDGAERAVVADICARLDGLPLAVELAAAQLVALSPAQIRDRLDDPGTLRSARRDVADRHRSLDNAMEVTYRLLDGPQRDLFGRLSVFAGPFDLDAAETVAGGADVLAPLTALITGSLVTPLPATSPRRYRMLQTLRQYAIRRMKPADLRDAQHRHLDRAVALAATADRELRGPDARRWFAVLTAEQDNLRAALAFACGGADPAAGLRLAADLAWFWYRGGHIVEGLRWLGLGLAGGGAADERARAHTGMACLHYLAGDLAASGTAITAAVELAETPATAARAAAYRTLFLGLRGEVAAGAAAGRDAQARALATGESWLLAEALISVAQVTWAGGDAAGAAVVLDYAVAAATASGFAWAAASARWMHAQLALSTGRFPEAYQLAARAVADLDEQDDVTGWLAAAFLLAATLTLTGRPEAGAVLLGAVEALGGRVGYAPERMDPVNGPRLAGTVRGGLPPEEFAAAHARGSAMTREQVRSVLLEHGQ
ncbi:BTAD domain-containing putative transcriptional regulator [Dactylosporangium sp. AC04546]|uniref:BTAD domain-containing putative transcriptional regulator n=1 Tax=Dactylosporangium sp. AC04546 TaxID=2862460 RepID=UPI0027E19284|nr:BTAD domain-containing putative transcriptional regulator [Dactylosporangium sp. AC04546]WVK80013.1 BTAD domain-containing putative transcriptional regulator [Dactylosporangium sp. AC04546]